MSASYKTLPLQRIAVLITCHNRREKSLACLRALFDQSLPEGVSLDVFLVDDGSTDGTGYAVRNQFPHVRVLEGDGNLYWCGGMRFAWTEAMNADYDGYVWLNDDTTLLPHALEMMIDSAYEVRAKEGRDGIIVGSCYDPETGKHSYGGRNRLKCRSSLADQSIEPGDKILPCDTMNGNLVLIPRQVFNSLGNLSQEYTHAFGDTDYGMRGKNNGFGVWISPGYLAECAINKRVPAWINPRVPLKRRWNDMKSPLGLPIRQWLIYVKRHTGIAWPIYFVKPIVRLLFPWIWILKSK